MLARVKQEYRSGPVMAFSGREYVLSEWREVPAGFDDEARQHPLLDTQSSLDETRAMSSKLPGLGKGEVKSEVKIEAPQAETKPEAKTLAETKTESAPTESQTPRRPRKRAAED